MPRLPSSSTPSARLPESDAPALLLNHLRLQDNISEPYYLQLQRQIESLIRMDALPGGSSMPSERDLAEALRVSRATVKRTYDILRRAHLLTSNGRRGGTAVSHTPHVSPVLTQLKGFTEEMRELGFQPATRVLERAVVKDRVIAAVFGRSPTAKFLRLVRLRLADDMPMSREVAWYDIGHAPALVDWSGEGSAYAFLRDSCGISLAWADQSVEAITSSDVETAAFGFDGPQPCLLLKRLSCTADDQRIEYAEGTFRGDAYRYRLRMLT